MKTLRLLLVFVAFGSVAPVKAQQFLDRHTGTYKGTLHLLFPQRQPDSVGFELLIQPTKTAGSWSNTVRYLGDNGAIGQVKAYELTIDPAFGDDIHYLLDEKDGILITETRIGNTCYATYTVDDLYFTVTTSFQGSYVDYELVCYSLLNKRESESEPDEENKRWKVDSFPLMTVQKGRLYKQ